MTVAGRVVFSPVRQPMGENKWLAPLLVFVAVMALWEAAVRLLQVPVFLLPPPSAILTTFINNAGTLLLYGFNTFRQAFLGFAIGCGLGDSGGDGHGAVADDLRCAGTAGSGL
jgi:ABC-type nitrate/sulfonate/bicarbonate transport system permease component